MTLVVVTTLAVTTLAVATKCLTVEYNTRLPHGRRVFLEIFMQSRLLLPYDHKHDTKAKKCYDCESLKGLSRFWWCVNKEAIEYRGTIVVIFASAGTPGICKCVFWTPCKLKKPPIRIRIKRYLATVSRYLANTKD